MRRCDWLESRRSTSVCGANGGAGSAEPSGEIDGKRPNASARSESSGRSARLPTRNAPPREPAHWRERKATIASRVNVRRCSSGPSTGRPSGWSPNAARSIRCSATTDGWSLARAISWITTPRSRSSSGIDLRAADEVGQEVDRVGRHLGAAGDVEGHQVVRRVGVEHRAHPLGGLVDLAVVVVLLAALEHQVLEEVRHPVLLGPLGAGAGVERHQHGGRPSALDLDPVDREAGRDGGRFDARHRRNVAHPTGLRCRRAKPYLKGRFAPGAQVEHGSRFTSTALPRMAGRTRAGRTSPATASPPPPRASPRLEVAAVDHLDADPAVLCSSRFAMSVSGRARPWRTNTLPGRDGSNGTTCQAPERASGAGHGASQAAPRTGAVIDFANVSKRYPSGDTGPRTSRSRSCRASSCSWSAPPARASRPRCGC